jgi:hypothetical protein
MVSAPLLLLGLLPQRLEPRVPELVDEGPQLAETLGPGSVQTPRPLPPLDQQAGVAQHAEVLRDGGPGYVDEPGRDGPRR